jgi:amino acid transporter
VLFGAGLGLIVDEYWLLLTLNESVYFNPESIVISSMIGLAMTVIYALITVGLLLYTKKEKQLWDTFREKVKEEKVKIKI